MKGIIISLFFMLCWNMLSAQKLDSLEKRLIQGDIKALYKIAAYLDSDSVLTEHLGYHILHTPVKEIAKRLIEENTIFLDDEFKIDTSTSSKTFLAFLKANKKKIIFSEDAKAFLITPLIYREVKYEIRGLTGTRIARLRKNARKLMQMDWVKENHIDSLILHKNPLALFKIASEFYKSRSRFNRDQPNPKEYAALLELLTETNIGVENEKHDIDYHTDSYFDLSAKLKLGLLVYFAKHYSSYKWDDQLHIFSDSTAIIHPLNKENDYFESLSSKDAAVAMNAFIRLTTSSPANVIALTKEYEYADIDNNNGCLPTFAYRFLEQLTLLTAYCNQHHIDFKGSYELTENIKTLKGDMTFTARRQLEDKLINTLTPAEITAFEYWCLIYEESFELTYSAGRILDIFYSKNWDKITGDKLQLDLYLKKSKLFDRLGIIGTCNNYLKKFTDADKVTLGLLENYTSDDTDITTQAKAATDTFLHKTDPDKINLSTDRKESVADYNTHVENLENEFSMIVKSDANASEKDKKVSTLLSKISYGQIGKALSLIENYTFESEYEKYSFMERDFSFFIGDFAKTDIRKEFISYYNTHTESEVYAYYLAKGGIDYTHPDHSLDLDKIYEILKYNVVTAFVGGGGGVMDNEVYAVIKLLELKFNTTQGFPKKLCCSDNMYACDAADRATIWMIYLNDMGLLHKPHYEPVSFHSK